MLGISREDAYIMNNTLLREARSTIWGARSAKRLPLLKDLKERLKRQLKKIIMVIKDKQIVLGLKKLIYMAKT